MHFRQIGIAALGKSAQEIECRGRLTISRDLPLRVGHARGGVKFNAIDDVAAIAGQFNTIDCFGISRARLGKLSGHPTDLNDRQLGTISQHNCHLQQYAERVADIVGVMLDKAFSAIAALKQKRAPLAHFGKLGFQIARFASKNKRRVSGKAFFHRLQGRRIFVMRHLLNREIPPAV